MAGVYFSARLQTSPRKEGDFVEVSNLRPNSRMPPYYMFPRFLMDLDLPDSARIVYMFLLDRARISMKSPGWTDESGNVYLIYTLESLAKDLHRGTTAVKKGLKILETAGLIRRFRQGLGKPNRIYVLVPWAEKRLPDSRRSDRQMGGNPPGRNNNGTIRTYECEEWESL